MIIHIHGPVKSLLKQKRRAGILSSIFISPHVSITDMTAITGATGHLGQAILRQLKESRIPVRAVVRASSNTALLEGLCTEIHQASLDNTESLIRAFTDADAVIHCAALIDIRRGHAEELRKVNVEGTANVLEACRRAGVRRMVYIASIEAIDIKNPARPITEGHGFADGNAVMEYGNSKAESARMVIQAGKQPGLPETAVICPTAIIGPWDFHKGLNTTFFLRHLNGKIPGCLPGGFDYVDVRDVAAAVIAAVSRGKSGETYITGGRYISVFNLLKLIEKAAGIQLSTSHFPLFLGKLGGEAAEIWSRLTGRKILFTRGSVKILQSNAQIDCSKARNELEFEPRPLEETIRDTVSWLQSFPSSP